MINYIIQVVLFQTLFLAVYDLFLQKETFFKWNRVYLLATPILAFIIPLLKFKSIQQSIPQEYMVQLPTVFLNPEAVIIQSTTSENTFNVLPILFYIGIMVFLTLFIVRLFKIINLIIHNKKITQGNFKLVLLREHKAAFSFFNYIFIHKKLLENKKLDIIKHETIHCKQLHTLDLLFFEVLKIGMWFNPLVYVYQKRITLLHEYISDAEVVKASDKKTYFNTLLAETFNVENILFVNQFFKQSLIKKRIVMIAKEKSQKIKQLKYLLVVPLLIGMLLFSSFGRNAIELENELPVIIDEVFTEDLIIDNEFGLESEISNDKEVKTLVKKELQNIGVKNMDTISSNDIPFAYIEDVPVFPGCEGTKEELRTCLQEKITEHVAQTFNADLANDLGLTAGVKRIFVLFKIDKEGNIVEAMARAPHKSLEEEAIRVVQSLPKMEPGKQKGIAVGVKYSLPIAFKVDGEQATNEQSNKVKEDFIDEEKAKYFVEGEDIPFAYIEDVPVFPGCEGTKSELKQCLIENITKHVNRNFNTNLTKSLGLAAGVKQVYVMFKIDKAGNIVDVKSRAPHKSLEEEAIRVIESLPKMKPGKYKGKEVGVKYSLPIAFKIS